MSFDRYRQVVPDYDRFIASMDGPEAVTFRVRGGRPMERPVTERLSAAGFEIAPVPGIDSYFSVLSGAASVGQSLEHWLGHIHVQQAVMALPSLALEPEPGSQVLDLCAAPGGKTAHLADLMRDRGPLVAVDPQEKRIRGLLANLYRLGCSNVVVIAADGRRLPGGALFDRVLVDAPCSGEANRRRPGARSSPSRKFLGYVNTLQEALLRRAIDLTRPGGLIVYSTCTFAPEENEVVVARVLADAPVSIEPIPLDVPHASGLTRWDGSSLPGDMEAAWRTYPHQLPSGGGLFMARLRRLGGGEATSPVARTGGDGGWSEIPPAFPGEDPDVGRARISAALKELELRFGITADHLAGVGWMARSDHLWLQTAGSWPVESWETRPEKGWRLVSTGLRATRGSPGRPETPSNDFLVRWGPCISDSSKVDLAAEDVGALLRGRSLPNQGWAPGPVALQYRGEVIGRGRVTHEGLRHEIPRAHAERLLREVFSN